MIPKVPKHNYKTFLALVRDALKLYYILSNPLLVQAEPIVYIY